MTSPGWTATGAGLGLSASEMSLLRFGVIELDLKTGELRKAGTLIHLPPQPFKILALLASRPGQLVTREEIQQQIWGGETFVDFEAGLNAAIKTIRDVLGDNPETPRYIETLPRRGYRFIVPVETARRAVSEEETLHRSVSTAHGGAPAVAPVSPPATDVGAGLVPAPGRPQGAPLRKRWVIAAAGAAVVVAVTLVALNVTGLRERLLRTVGAVREPPLQIRSIAVLPLENLSGDKEQEYFADGMTEELITNLGRVSALRVISRTSVKQYKGTKKTLPQIARELNVDAVVEGSVVRSGGRVRITANLLHAATDRHLWAESYESDLRDVLVLQGEIARSISREVQVKLTPQEASRLTTVRAVNPQAYEAYLRGKHTYDLRFFEEAIRLDPQLALPQAELAGFYQFNWGLWGLRPPHEAYPKAEKAARRALSLDDTLSDAHAVLAMVHMEYYWNFPEAERELRRALELKRSSDHWHSYVHYLLLMGRLAESRAESERAAQIHPFDTGLRTCVAWHCLLAGEYDQAETICREALRTDPNNYWGHLFLGWTLEQKQMFNEAVAEFKAASALWNEPAIPTTSLAHAYAVSGRTREARTILAQLIQRSKRAYVSPYEIAVIYAGLGEPDRAFEWLDKAYNERSGFLIYFRADPRLEPLRSDERFEGLVRRIGLPPAADAGVKRGATSPHESTAVVPPRLSVRSAGDVPPEGRFVGRSDIPQKVSAVNRQS